jgi:hypothetical protein
MDNYIVLYGLLVIVIVVKTSWLEYLFMRKNPSKYRKEFLSDKLHREIVFELLHKFYTHPKFSNKNKTSVTDNIETIRSVVRDYLKDTEYEGEPKNARNRKN